MNWIPCYGALEVSMLLLLLLRLLGLPPATLLTTTLTTLRTPATNIWIASYILQISSPRLGIS